MRPSDLHSNNKLHNWLVYYYRNKHLQALSSLYQGSLYDLGCGEAAFKPYFEQYCDRYVGVDWGDSFHQTKADIVANLNDKLPIEDAVADTVVSISVLEHLCEPQTMLNEAHRILKPGCPIVVQVPWQWMIHEAPHDYFRYSAYGLEYMFKKAGFIDVNVIPECGFFSMMALKTCYFLKRIVRGPRVVRMLLLLAVVPLWTVLQILGCVLDRLDTHPALEAGGYYVTARKS